MKPLLLLLFISNFACAQYWGGQEIKETQLKNWLPKFELEYAGSYHFGESESESDLHLFFSGNVIVGQVHNAYWEEKEVLSRKRNFINLTHIEIDKKGNFTSDQYHGKFVTFTNESGEVYKALKIDNPWTSWIEDSAYEIGTKTGLVFEHIYYGIYGKASYRNLDPNELKKMSKNELAIMRNEIYARYGYIFIKNGKMDQYFTKQDWYTAEHKDVDRFLNEIELSNIQLIKGLE